MKFELEGKIHELSEKLQKTESKISNLDKYINLSEEVAENISKYWASGGGPP